MGWEKGQRVRVSPKAWTWLFLQPLRNSLLNECWSTCQDRMGYLLWQKQGVTHHLKAENIFQRVRVSEPCLCSKVSELRDSTRIWGIKTKQSCKGLGKWRPKRVNWKGVNRAWVLLRWIKRLGKRISKLLCWEQIYNGETNKQSQLCTMAVNNTWPCISHSTQHKVPIYNMTYLYDNTKDTFPNRR